MRYNIFLLTKQRVIQMNEKILEIREADFIYESGSYYPQSMEGFIVVTENQEIQLGISSGQSCCEQYGYFMTNDNIEDFVGATIREIRLTNTLLEVEDFNKEYSGDVMFVNIETNKGTLQFVAYNDHNGYYGHDALVVSRQLHHKECL